MLLRETIILPLLSERCLMLSCYAKKVKSVPYENVTSTSPVLASTLSGMLPEEAWSWW